MQVIRMSKSGSPCGSINLGLCLEGVAESLENGMYILSLRDSVWRGGLPSNLGDDGWSENPTSFFSLGEARASVIQDLDSGSRVVLRIMIESPNVRDFINLYNKVYARIGIPHTKIPSYPLEELSFIRGIRNDWKKLAQFLGARWRAFRSTALQ